MYKRLLKVYHHTLDLMSARALASLDTKFGEAKVFADIIAPQLSPAARILDVGSGAGLPGVPLAIAFPNHQITWVERRQRRANFLRIVVSQLELANVVIVPADVRTHQDATYSWICAQAVGRDTLLYCLTRHLHTETVTLVTRRGDLSPTERADLERITGPVLAETVAALPSHGTLVARRLQGGQRCPSSV